MFLSQNVIWSEPKNSQFQCIYNETHKDFYLVSYQLVVWPTEEPGLPGVIAPMDPHYADCYGSSLCTAQDLATQDALGALRLSALQWGAAPIQGWEAAILL